MNRMRQRETFPSNTLAKWFYYTGFFFVVTFLMKKKIEKYSPIIIFDN